MINIISGKFKNTKLEVLEKIVRPTSVIKRKSIFSIVESYAIKNQIEIYEQKSIIDLFAGSGALGIEAISRGATFGYFFDINREVCDKLYKNCNKIIRKSNFQIIQKDSREIKKIIPKLPISLIFIDPPYNLYSIDDILLNFIKMKILQKNTIIIVESDKKEIINFKKNFFLIKEKKYTKNKILFLKRLN